VTVDVVDGHLHLFKPQSDEYPRDIFEGMTPPEREAPAEDFLAAMEDAGVDRAIVVPLSPHDRYLGEILKAYPGKFAGIGVYDFATADPVADLEHRIEEIGIQGLRLYGLDAEPGSDPESLPVFALLEAMRRHDMKVWFYGHPEQLKIMDAAMTLLPGLKVVMNHLAFCPDMHMELRIDEDRRPQFDVTLPPASLPLVEEIAARQPDLYVHFSGQYAFTGEPYPYRDLQETAERVYAAFGADRMIMASDWPWIRVNPGYREVLALVDHYLPDLTADERDAVRGGTAMRLFRF
jgi:predicted TIM-barrel fold metal-dependent hydrolase